MRTIAEHADDIRKHRGHGREYAVAVGKIDGTVQYPPPGATDADVLAEIKNILAALDLALAEGEE